MGIVVVFKNPCNPSFTYTINGPEAEYLGRGDFHDTRYDHIGIHGTLQDLDLFSKEDVRKSPNSPYSGIPLNEDYCQFNISIYPSIQREEMFTTSTPVILTVMAVVIFVFASMVFVAYDITVERRQRIVMNTAVTSRAIVSSLYPEVVRDRIVEAKATARSGPGAKRRESRRSFMFRNSGHFLAEPNRDASVARSVASDDAIQMLAGKPIAELYPETTVMFADITGFTPWSSAREPHQVFHLLETIFTAFDEVSKRCGVFKIESVGDKYVAVAGLPKAQELHAVIMARFAAMCRDKMNGLIVDLEKTLGPGTAELQVRIGLNSGATIAGVLRNEKSLFQIFGYTVNIALKMETYGLPNRIQATKKTADLLIAAGKQSWVRTRDDLINIKSKGRIKTYWIEPWNADARSLGSSVTFTMEKSDFCDPLPPHVERLVDWTVDLLEKTLLEMTAQPVATSLKYESSHNDVISSAFYQERLPRSEVSDCLLLPVFHHNRDYNVPPIKPNKLKSDAKYLLRDFISAIASMHQDNSNAFEDAVNVINAVMKLMSTLIPPEEENLKGSKRGPKSRSPYSILSDPMVRFGMIFAALVHNVGDTSRHTAKKYGNKSVLEQSSVDVAWDLLTQPGYDSLRDSIFRTDTNVKRARQLLVNAVMATDTNDPELNASLDFRWRELFSASEKTPSKLYMSDEEKCSCQAKLILELVMQAAKVHHCMQHWELYLKRSRRRFNEVYAAYKKCRVSKDPSVDLYVRELTHFDTKVIPLSKKIRDCGVFGVSFHEMLDYAKSNRLDWESRGEQMVKDWIELYNSDDEDEDEDEEKIEA